MKFSMKKLCALSLSVFTMFGSNLYSVSMESRESKGKTSTSSGIPVAICREGSDSIKWFYIDQIPSDAKCLICLDPITIKDPNCVMLACGSYILEAPQDQIKGVFNQYSSHICHRKCALPWLEEKEIYSCPTCKREGSVYFIIFNNKNLSIEKMRLNRMRCLIVDVDHDKKIEFVSEYQPSRCVKCDRKFKAKDPFVFYGHCSPLNYCMNHSKLEALLKNHHGGAICLVCADKDLKKFDMGNDQNDQFDINNAFLYCPYHGKNYTIIIIYHGCSNEDSNLIHVRRYARSLLCSDPISEDET